MTDPPRPRWPLPACALGDGAAAYDAAVERARTEEWATRLFARDVDALDDRRAGRRGDRRAARLARRAGPFRRPDGRPRGVRRRRRRRGLHDRGRGRDGRQQPRAGRPPPDVRLDRGLSRAAHPRLDRPGVRVGDARRPRPARGRCVIIATKSGTTTEPNAFLAYAWDRAEQALEAVPHHTYEQSRRVLRGHHRPGQERRADRPPRRLPRGLPQPARHRRPLLGADLCRARAGVAHRDRPRRRSSRRRWRCSAPAASPTRQPTRALSLGLAIGTLAKAGRDKLTFLADDEIASFGAWAGAAHRREHRQARRRDRPGRPRAARSRSRPTARTAPSSGSPSAGGTGRRPRRARRRRSRRPAIRSSGSTSPTRSTSAPSAFRWEVATAFAGRRPRHRPVRPAQRRGGQAADPRPARGTARPGPARDGGAADGPSRSRAATA